MTKPARPGDPSSQPRKGPAPPPPPWWRNYLLIFGVIATFYLLFHPVPQPSVTQLSYTQFLNNVQTKQVQTATIDSNGGVTGTLKDGSRYSSQIPTAIDDTQLATTLRTNGVQITAVGPPGQTFLGVILSFLPLLLFVGFYTEGENRLALTAAGRGRDDGNNRLLAGVLPTAH